MKPRSQVGTLNRVYINLVYPLLNAGTYRGLGRRVRAWESLERLPADKLANVQWTRLLSLLEHAYNTTPFYRKRFDQAGLRPCDIQAADDLKRVLPLTRQDLREHLNELYSRKYPLAKLQRAATGGTTDTPTSLLRSPYSIREKVAIQTQFNIWAGNRPGDKVFFLWGARQDYDQNPSLRWRLYDRYLMRRIWAPTSLFNEEVLESYRQTLNRFRPRVIFAYPSPLALFCEYLRNSGKDVHHPQVAICTAEALLPTQRQIIQETLGVKLFEQYGSREFGMIAAECECHCGMHMNSAAVYVEYVPVEGAETQGLHEILVTDLLNDGMPLIRYRINDCVIPGPTGCRCGRGYPLLKQVVGRTADNFVLGDGSVVPGVSLTNRVIQVCPGVKKLQVIQVAVNDFRLCYVPGPDFNSRDLDSLRSKLSLYFPERVHWTFEQVSEIQRESSGKTRFCISRVENRGVASTYQQNLNFAAVDEP